jgi:outer membrane protein assembly factor BamA
VRNKLIVLLFCVLTIFAGGFPAFSIDLEEFSENKKLFVYDVTVNGNNIMSEKEIFEISGFDKEAGFFIRDIKRGINKLKNSGYFTGVTFFLSQGERGYLLEITVKENPPLASLKVLDSKMLDLTVLRKRLKQNNVNTDMVFSSVMLEKSIEEFNIYNQNAGIFLYIVTFRAVTRDEIMREGGIFLYDPGELQKNGVHVVIYIKEITRMVLGEVRMTGISISYDQILKYLTIKQGMPVSSDADLHFVYKRLKKLGFYDHVYFKLIQKDEMVYALEIQGKEISLSEISTSLTAPTNIGIIMTAEYYNIAVFDTMQRFRAGAGWELMVGAPVFVLEYTHPFFWNGLFADILFTKSDTADSIKDKTDMRLSSNYEGKSTIGYNLIGNFFTYVYQREIYKISRTVDDTYSRIDQYPENKALTHATGVMMVYDDLDDNFFITQGFKLMGEFETIWKLPRVYKAQASGEVYIPIPFFNVIVAMNNRSNFLVADKKDKISTLQTDERMRTNVQEIQSIGDTQIKMTTYTSGELRFPLPQDVDALRDMCFIIFGEAGGSWGDYNAVSLKETRYGFGIGLRLSPRKHYSSFLFQFPAGLYFGYRVGDTRVKPTLVSHRDEMYYINLTASF